MDADRWQRISDALAAALEATTGERERLLGALDGPDRDEVRQLLACGLRNPGFLSEPASVIAARQLAEEDACLRLGPWQLREQIGKGGMAVVYRAERDDGHFRKSAAAKILRFGIHGEDVRQRFQRERQVLAELSHPNIVRLWDGGVTPDGRPYLVEDFVDGPPVTEWAKARNLDLESRLRLFLAVCDAVAYAHERGVIHRDIKPGNILTTSEGLPMLVDFGIAGLIQPGSAEPGGTQTVARYWTPEYASPEQARGEVAGRRSDVYSLSMVLYELLLERRPYRVEGLPPQEAQRVIGEQEPDWNDADRRLRAVLRMGLAKEPARRYSGARELAEDLRRYLGNEKTDAERMPEPLKWRRMALIATSAAIPCCLAGFALWPASKPAVSNLHPVAVASSPDAESSPALSPDGAEVVFAVRRVGERNHLFRKQLPAGEPQRMRDTPAQSARFSMDGRFLVVEEHRLGRNREFAVVDRLNGSEHPLGEFTGDDAALYSWTADGKALVVSNNRFPGEPLSLVSVERETGKRTQLTQPEAGTIGDFASAFSPDGRWAAVVRCQGRTECDLYLMPAAGGAMRRLTREPASFRGLDWTPDSQEIVYSSDNHSGIFRLFRIRIGDRDPQPRVITEAGHGAIFPSFSRKVLESGAKLAYAVELRDVNVWRWNPASGTKPEPLAKSNEFESSPAFSPDGKRVALRSSRSGFHEIWVANSDGTFPLQITSFRGGIVDSPLWSPDNKVIAFSAQVGSNRFAFVVSASGGEARRVSTSPGPAEEGRPSFSRDGRWIYFHSNRGGSQQVWKAPVARPSEPRQITRGGGFEAVEAADGRVYYVRDRLEAGLFAVPSEGGAEALVAPDVRAAFWVATGDGIYYVSRPNRWRGNEVRFYRFDTGSISKVATIPTPSELLWGGFSATRDGRTIAWTQMDRDDSDIMLIENFR